MGLGDFVRRHRRKIAVALGLVGTTYWLIQYLGNKLRELQERIVLERLAKENLEQRFEQNQKDASFTILALLPTFSTQVLDAYDVESVKQQLQALRSDPASSSQSLENSSESVEVGVSKSDLWNQIKIKSFTRVFTLIYTSALLVLLTRLQLNILGRRAYIDSVRKASSALDAGGDDVEREDEENRRFLSFSWWLLNRGWQIVATRVERSVEAVIGDVDPRSLLTYNELSDLVGKIQYTVDHPSQGPESFLGAILPPAELETFVQEQTASSGSEISPELRRYLDETADLVESPNAVDVIQRLVHSALVVLMERLSHLYAEQTTVRLASALAVLTRQAHQLAAGSPMSNDYVDVMIRVPELDVLCALVYSNY